MSWPAEAVTLTTSPPILPLTLVVKVLNKTDYYLFED
jgi:hypothetical protein